MQEEDSIQTLKTLQNILKLRELISYLSVTRQRGQQIRFFDCIIYNQCVSSHFVDSAAFFSMRFTSSYASDTIPFCMIELFSMWLLDKCKLVQA